jgi:hypothetical protein
MIGRSPPDRGIHRGIPPTEDLDAADRDLIGVTSVDGT